MKRLHKVGELVVSGEILVQKIHTSKNAADVSTKVITSEKFQHCLDLLGVSRCQMNMLVLGTFITRF